MNNAEVKIAFHTLGCKLNFSETSTMSRQLNPRRFTKVPFDESADVYIIHTCTVTEAADRKCRHLINKTIRRSPDAFIIIAGCYAQLNSEKLRSIPGVDLVLGSNEKFNLQDYLENLDKRTEPEIHYNDIAELSSFFPAWSGGDRTRSFLKVQDGCDYSCTYCTVPKARGKSRSNNIQSVLKNLEEIAGTGVKEVVLTGVNTGDFGRNTGETFCELLREIVKTEGIERFRISSVEPNLITDDIIEFVAANPKILPHFHIPLQSGSNKILGLMKRRYNRELFAARVSKIRELMPLAGIGADVIAGFPGETEKDFTDSLEFIDSLDLSYLHAFSYSARPGTPASGFKDQVDKPLRHERSKILQELSDRKEKAFKLKCKGSLAKILWEYEEKPGYISGFTENYIRVYREFDSSLTGKITGHRLKETDENGNFIV